MAGMTIEVERLEHLLSSSQVARRLEIGQNRIKFLVAQGDLREIRTPLGGLFDPADVEKLARHRAELRSRRRAG